MRTREEIQTDFVEAGLRYSSQELRERDRNENVLEVLLDIRDEFQKMNERNTEAAYQSKGYGG